MVMGGPLGTRTSISTRHTHPTTRNACCSAHCSREPDTGITDALPAMPHAPTASVMHGAAGLAYALYRLALVRGDAEMLALADLWGSRALAASGCAGRIRRCGTRAHLRGPFRQYAVSHDRGYPLRSRADRQRRGRSSVAGESVDAFIGASPVPARGVNLDLMLGHTGVLIASALLLEALAPIHEFPRQRLAEHGTAALAAIEEAARVAAGDA